MIRLSTAFLVFMLCACCASAHLEGGNDTIVNGVRFDIGWDPEPIRAGDTTTLSVGARNDTTAVDTLWVRISKEDNIFFAGDLTTTDGVATIAMNFPQSGTYTLTVRAGDTQTTFPVQVVDQHRANGRVIFGILIICATLLIARTITKKRKKTRKL